MSTLTRLRDFSADRDAVPPVAISAEGMDDEFDQLIAESNLQDTRLDTLEAGGNVSTADLADDCVTPSKASFIDDSLAATDTHIMVADGTDFSNVVVSGDATLSNTGVLTIGNDKIVTAYVLDANITTSKILDANITEQKLATDSVSTVKILDANITTAKILDSNITTSKILDGNITTSKILDANITTAKILDSNITTSKILDGNITTSKIADGAITSNKLSADCVVESKVADNSLMNADINTSAGISATKIYDGSISNTEFGYLNGLSSNIQSQMNNISAGTVSTVDDSIFRVCDNSDATKKTAVQSSGITTGTVRTITMADQDIDLTPDTGTFASAGSGVSVGLVLALG